jgi:hypothetical protein
MQNGNQKNGREEFPKSDIMSWDFKNDNVEGLKKKIHKLIQSFRDFSSEPQSATNETSPASNQQLDVSSEKSPDNSEGFSEKSTEPYASKTYSPKAPYPCFFFKALDMQILSNIPNFQGVRIFIGGKDADTLIIVPITKVNPYEETYSQTYTTNGEEKTTSTAVTLESSKTPCPPYPDGMTRCP